MGGCSSKPKTAEFEGSMDLQEGKPQDATMSLEAETIGVDAGLKGIDRAQESSESAIQVLLAEKDDLHDALAEPEKHLIAGFNPEDDFKEGMQIREDDPKHVKQTKELQGSPLPSAAQAESVNSEKESLSPTEKSVEMEEKHVFVESDTLVERNEHVTSAKDVSKLQVKPTGPQDETLELESQKEEQKLDDGPGHKGQCERIEEANKEFAVLEPAREDQNAKGEAMEEAAEGVTTSTSVDMKSPSAKASDQQPLEIQEITDSICVAAPVTTAAVSPDDLQLMVGEQAFVLVGHEEQMQAESVDGADGTGAEILAKSQAEPVWADLRPTDDFQLNGETVDTTLVEGDYICGKINGGNEYLSSLAVVSEEPIHTELPENSAVELQGEKLNTSFICNGGQLKLDVSSTSEQVTAPQVTATTEKPEAQFVPVKEPAEPAFRKDISAQEISAPDIDEVWEKLASEFERQESLARVTP